MFASLVVVQLFLTLPYLPGQPLPETVTVEVNGIKRGTMTLSDGIAVFRDAKGELAGSLSKDKDGKPRFYDPDGKPMNHHPLNPPQQ